jgi:hypothetical protein
VISSSRVHCCASIRYHVLITSGPSVSLDSLDARCGVAIVRYQSITGLTPYRRGLLTSSKYRVYTCFRTSEMCLIAFLPGVLQPCEVLEGLYHLFKCSAHMISIECVMFCLPLVE